MTVKKITLSERRSAKGVKKKANFFAFFSRRAKPLCIASVRLFLAKERLKGKQSVASLRWSHSDITFGSEPIKAKQLAFTLRFSPRSRFESFYEHLKSNGKHSTVAQIAVMKKLILLAYSLYKNNQKYDPLRYLKYQQTKQECL